MKKIYTAEDVAAHFAASNEPLIDGLPMVKFLQSTNVRKLTHDEKEEAFSKEHKGEAGVCKRCKEWTEVGNSCCGDEHVHID